MALTDYSCRNALQSVTLFNFGVKCLFVVVA